jgi:26S proteasome non-ATPase regulatory subunit 5
MHPPTTQLLYQYLNYHLLELRYAVFALIKAVVKHTWGLTEILAFPGMADYLLNRRTEPTKLGKEWKYSIIEAIVQQPSAKDIAGTEYYTLFLTYLKQGIFFVAAENAVQVEKEVGE